VEIRRNFWAVILPPALWLGVFFIAPLLLMAAFSFRAGMGGRIFSDWGWTLDNYTTLSETPSYMRLLWTSGWMALLVAVLGTIFAYPLACFLAFRVRLRAHVYLTLLIIPFWTSYLLRVLAWKLILGSGGVINAFLLYLRIIEEPISVFFYSRFAVIVTLTYVWTPFVALPILASLQRIDRSLLEAAANLGASPFHTFLRVTLPLSLPGVIAGAFMVFIPTIGEYVTPLLVGGSSGFMYGNIIQDFFGRAVNWPLGAALAVVMLGTSLALVSVIARVLRLAQFLR